MSFLNRALRRLYRLSRLGISDAEESRNLVPQINFSSNITPIKMAMEVFQSNATDPNAPALIIMHGFLGSKNNFNGICKRLEPKTKRMVRTVVKFAEGSSKINGIDL